MPRTGSLRRCLYACLASLLLTQCQAITRFQDCQSDTDCAYGQICNQLHHFCQTDTAEVCGSGMDVDQDGLVDTQQTYGPCQVAGWQPGMPGCPDGVIHCVSGLGKTCVQRTTTMPEDCFNGIDDDCNGIVDDSAACVQNYGPVPPSAPMHIGSNDPAFGEGDDAPDHQICLGSFQIDKYEVSTRAYLQYLNELDPQRVSISIPMPSNPTILPERYILVDGKPFVRYPMAPGSDDRLAIDFSPSRGWIPVHSDVLELPMVNVTWYGADAYCRWAGKHLPTEAEWWRAARGPTGLTNYPWGNTPDPDCTHANIGVGGSAALGDASMGTACVGLPVAVNQIPAGRNPEGVFNLYGNVNEWMFDYLNDVIDHTRNNYYQDTPDGGWCNAYPLGPTGPDSGAPIAQPNDAGLACLNCRFARGRNYTTTDTRPGIRRWLDSDRGEDITGFRCSSGGAPR